MKYVEMLLHLSRNLVVCVCVYVGVCVYVCVGYVCVCVCVYICGCVCVNVCVSNAVSNCLLFVTAGATEKRKACFGSCFQFN